MQANVNLDALLEKMKAELERGKRKLQPNMDVKTELGKAKNCLDAVSRAYEERET